MTIRFKQTRFEISFYFAAAVTLLLLFDKSGKAALGVAAAVIHEAGHLLCLIWWGVMPSKISLLPFGMRIERKGAASLSYNREAVTALAGPAMNLFLAGATALILTFTHNQALLFPIAVNLGLALLNLLPLEPLDGGRILRALLLKKYAENKCDSVLKWVTAAFLLPLASAGFYVLIKSGYNFTLLAVCIYIVVLLILKK
jgi:stage IV sporulation protein FB